MTIKERLIKTGLKALGSTIFNYSSAGSYQWYNYLLGNKTLKNVMESGYEGNTYVYSIINRIAQTGAGLPIVIWEVDAKGEKVEIVDGDFYDFIHNPNENNNLKTFVYESLVYQLASGNEVIYGEELPGLSHVLNVYNLAPQYIVPEWIVNKTGVTPTKYRYQISGQEFTYMPEEVMHLRKFNPDPNCKSPVMGLSPLQAGFATLSASNDVILADASLIKNKGMAGMLTNKSGKPMSTENANAVDQALKKRIGGGEKFGSIGMTNQDLGFIQFAMSPEQLKILESGLFKKRDLCDLFNVDSTVFNDPANKKNNNRKEGSKAFITEAVLPPTEAHWDMFNKKFVRAWEDRDNKTYIVEVNKDKIEVLQEDQEKKAIKQKTQAEAIRIIVEGAGVEFSIESGIRQLMHTFEMNEENAKLLIGDKIESNGQE